MFYHKLNDLLGENGFDVWIEDLCRPYYADMGRPGIPPGVYFRILLVGYFEGLGSQRGIAWRCADSLSLRKFLGLTSTEDFPDHSLLAVIRERLYPEVHEVVFQRARPDPPNLNGQSASVRAAGLDRTALNADGTVLGTPYCESSKVVVCAAATKLLRWGLD